MARTRRVVSLLATTIAALAVIASAGEATGVVRILPLGDSVTNGGNGFASFRYPLWFDLLGDGFAVDFAGRRNGLFPTDTPDLALYPHYYTGFDRDHEGYWGHTTQQIANLVDAAAAAALPDVVLVHLGTNDIGLNGAAGVTTADANLRFIIGRLRAQNPHVAVLIARVIPIGCCGIYTPNAGFISALNAAVDQIAADLDTLEARVIAVDHHSGFDADTMLQGDGTHPTPAGERFMADRWRAALAVVLAPTPAPVAAIAGIETGFGIALRAALFVAALAILRGATRPAEHTRSQTNSRRPVDEADRPGEAP